MRRLSRQTGTLEADLELWGHGWILLKLAMEEISCRKIYKDKRIQTKSLEKLNRSTVRRRREVHRTQV